MILDPFLDWLLPAREKAPWEHPTTTDARNPMRWNCNIRGCFNKIKRPKIEEFAYCFPRGCQMSDIDGEVEVNSHWLRLEWKSDGGSLHRGQELNYQRLTQHCPRHVVLVVWGDSQFMSTIEKVDRYIDGKVDEDYMQIRTLDELRAQMTGWAQWAEQQQ
jgi:hypothetical protein